MEELIVASFKVDAVESTLIHQPLDQRHLERLGVAVSMGIALAQHHNLAMAEILRHSCQSSPVHLIDSSRASDRSKK